MANIKRIVQATPARLHLPQQRRTQAHRRIIRNSQAFPTIHTQHKPLPLHLLQHSPGTRKLAVQRLHIFTILQAGTASLYLNFIVGRWQCQRKIIIIKQVKLDIRIHAHTIAQPHRMSSYEISKNPTEELPQIAIERVFRGAPFMIIFVKTHNVLAIGRKKAMITVCLSAEL